VLGNAITLVLLVAIWTAYIYLRKPEIARQPRLIYFLMGLLVFVAILGRAIDFLAPNLIFEHLAAYFVPVAFAAGLATIFIGTEIGFSLAILLAFWVGLSWSGVMISEEKDALIQTMPINPIAIMAAFGSGAAAVFRCASLRRLSDLPLAGLQIGLFAIIMHAGASLIYFSDFSYFQDNALAFLWSGLNGLVSALLMFGALPLAEVITQRTSPLGLVELLNPSNPLLVMLREEAPGTYHHSVSVADLAERAAIAIGADPLLAKVGGLYHDIGKTRRPQFFIENQSDGVNPHDEISPSMSKMILTSHIKEGEELAREYGLRRDIVQFISEHHGTSVIRYFYLKALREGTATESSMGDFRYDSELPKSRETSIVMLADVVQAASSTLSDPADLEEFIHKVIQTPLKDEQLRESPITLQDIEKIEQSFFATLRAMRHDRTGSFPTESEMSESTS
jgi:hypothetical protein